MPPKHADLAFVEIARVEAIFRTFELSGGRVGQGRQSGDRNEMWGALSILARSALEEAIRRLHSLKCSSSECNFKDPNLHHENFFKFVDHHSGREFVSISEELHLRLRKKRQSNRGDGSGQDVSGPLSKEDVGEALEALNWIRNGFDHHGQNKLGRLPGMNNPGDTASAEGVYWVAGEEDLWTVQKPNAYSAIRLCRLVYRLIVAEWWGPEMAMASRTAPILFVADDRFTVSRSPELVLKEMLYANESGNPNDVLELVKELQLAILGPATDGLNQPLFSGEELTPQRPLSDPVVATRNLFPSNAVERTGLSQLEFPEDDE